MPLVVFSESSGFEMSEWVIHWSWSINTNAIPLGNIHTVHGYFMGVGDRLLPSDTMDSEWKQNLWRNQGSAVCNILFLPISFPQVDLFGPRERRQCIYVFSYRHGHYHLKLPAQKLTTQALWLRTLDMVNTSWKWSNSVLKRSQATGCLYKLDGFDTCKKTV